MQRSGDGYSLITGWHRLEAARKLTHLDIHAFILDGIDADRAALIEIDENLVRADLSPAERAIHLRERKRLYEKAHPETKPGGDRKSAQAKSNRQNGDLNRFTKDAEIKTGKSERSVQREVERAAKIPGLAEAIGTSLDTGDQLDALAKLPETKQRDLIKRAKAGERIDAKVEASRQHRAEREQELAESTIAARAELGKTVYGLIYADPPWRYDNEPMGDVARAVEEHYTTMALEDIKALPIPAANDCVLFLWATVPMMPEAIEVMKAWGFTYKSMSSWIKDKFGIGYWVRSQCEHLLIGVRGKVPSPARGRQFPAFIEAPRRGHSEKPNIFAEHIERLFPNVPKLEMFAREKRDGWDVWGNEVSARGATPQ